MCRIIILTSAAVLPKTFPKLKRERFWLVLFKNNIWRKVTNSS